MEGLVDPNAPPVPPDHSLARRRTQMQAWRRRSRLIGRMRRVLPVTAAVILLFLAGSVLLKSLGGGIGETRPGGAAIHMTNARFQGRDSDGRAYVLAATEASRSGGDIGRISLVKPTLIYNAEGLKPTQIVADTGLYREDNRLLTLQGHVLASDGDDTFRTSQAVADTLHLVINGWNRVEGGGPHGTITADSFGIYDHGKSIVFNGDVHSVLKRD